MSYCQQHSIVNELPGEHVCVSLRCRAWTCPDCAEDRKRGLIAQAHGGQPDTFLTLTMRRVEGLEPEAAALAISRYWRLVRLRALREAKRDITKTPTPAGTEPPGGWPRDGHGRVPRQVFLHGDRLPFLAVVEKHKSGWPHLHIMLRSKWMHQRWIAAQMAELADSPVQDIRRINGRAKVAAYVAKYAAKCAAKLGSAKRYWTSRDYDLRPADADPRRKAPRGSWSRLETTLDRWCMEQWYRWRVVDRVSAYVAKSYPVAKTAHAVGPPSVDGARFASSPQGKGG